MKNRRHILLTLFLITVVITFVIFFLFEEDKSCVLDFGTRCSNQFIIRAVVQSVVMTAVFYFSMKYGNKEKK